MCDALIHHYLVTDLNDKIELSHILSNRSIEKAAADNRLNNAAQIFLEEWITSGKIRPTLSHLLQLLVKSESFRAADYVAIDLLSGESWKCKFIVRSEEINVFIFG